MPYTVVRKRNKVVMRARTHMEEWREVIKLIKGSN